MLVGSPQWENTVLISSNNTQPADSESLGRIPLGKDEGASSRVATTGVVCVVQLGDACQPCCLCTVVLLQLL